MGKIQDRNDDALAVLTDRQRIVYVKYMAGEKQIDIANELGITKQAVSVLLARSRKRIAGKTNKSRTNKSRSRKSYTRPRIAWEKFADSDTSMLTEKQRRILQYRIDGKKGKDIAEIEKITENTVWATLNNCIRKITGENQNEYSEYHRNYNKVYRQKNKERLKTLYRDRGRKFRKNHTPVTVDKNITKINSGYVVVICLCGKNLYLACARDIDDAREIRDVALVKKSEGIEIFDEWFKNFKKNGRVLNLPGRYS